jgi:hypothetical protein
VAAALGFVTLAACSASPRSYDAADLAKLGKGWAPLAPGSRLLLVATGGDNCDVRVGSSRGDVETGGVDLSKQDWAAAPSIWQVKSLAGKGGGGFRNTAFVEVAETSGSRQLWLALPSGRSKCVALYDPELDAALAEKGKSYVFAPTAPACTRIRGAGSAFEKALASGDDTTRTVRAAEVRGGATWLSFEGGDFAVDEPTLRTCFSAPGASTGGLEGGSRVGALLRIDPARCDPSTIDGKPHLTCKTTLGVWESKDGALSFTRRTVGDVHFVDGRPAKSERFRRSVVVLAETGAAPGAREVALLESVRSGLPGLLATNDKRVVRLAAPGDKAITLRTSVVVRDVTIGDVVRKEENDSASFKVRDEQTPNTAKSDSRRSLADAEKTFEKNRQTCESIAVVDIPAKDNSAEKQACMNACLKANTGMGGVLCPSRCSNAGGGSQPAQKDDSQRKACFAKLREQEQVLKDARRKIDGMPDTVTSAVMSKWAFKRTIYVREATATLEVTTSGPGGKKTTSVKASTSARTTEVAADAAHNVKAEAPDRKLVDDPMSMMPGLRTSATGVLAPVLDAAIDRNVTEQIVLAFLTAGGTPKDGFEVVDAAAFELAASRIVRAETYGEGKALPTATLTLAPRECVLAVAAGDPGNNGTVTLRSADGAFGDGRGTKVASLEICAGETAGALPALEANSAGTVRWAIYRTSVGRR